MAHVHIHIHSPTDDYGVPGMKKGVRHEEPTSGGKTYAQHEASRNYWHQEMQRPIQAKGKRLAMEKMSHHEQHMAILRKK